LKAPIPKIKVVALDNNNVSKTPQKQLMSPGPEIKKPMPISLTPLGQKQGLKLGKSELAMFSRSPIGRVRKLLLSLVLY
jgi:hypothetical protein